MMDRQKLESWKLGQTLHSSRRDDDGQTEVRELEAWVDITQFQEG